MTGLGAYYISTEWQNYRQKAITLLWSPSVLRLQLDFEANTVSLLFIRSAIPTSTLLLSSKRKYRPRHTAK